LKEKKGKKEQKEPYLVDAEEKSVCREGGSATCTTERTEHISRREIANRGLKWGATEEIEKVLGHGAGSLIRATQ